MVEPKDIRLRGIGLIDELCFDRFAQCERESLSRHSSHLTQQCEFERWTDDRGRTQRRTRVLAKPRKAVLQRIADRRGKDDVTLSTHVVPPSVTVDEAFGLHERLEDLFGEERIAFGALVDRLDELL